VDGTVMGIYDREYYRRSGPSFLGAFAGRGTVCKWLIGANVAFFVAQLLTNDGVHQPFTDALQLDVGKVLHGEVWRLLTYAFLHDPGDFFHILFNMLFLWWFGSDVEDLYGPREFLAFYLTAALFGGAAYAASVLAGFKDVPALGASGAVTAVLVLCALHFPTRIIRVMWLIPVPIWLFVIFCVGYDLYTFLGRFETMTAVVIHLGGAAFALTYFKFQLRLCALWPSFKGWRRRPGAPRLKVYRDKAPAPRVFRPAPERDERVRTERDVVGVSSAPPPRPAAPDDEQLEAQVDAILEKISRVGKENLTEGELQVLRRASEALKRRRR
jgi:membrane associated rhomboid family serine protease